MSALDSLADRARAKSRELAGRGGIKDKLAEELAEDADFLRKLKPELIKQRAKGKAPTDDEPTGVRSAPSGPQLGERPEQEPEPERMSKSGPKASGGGGGGGPNPFVVIGIALVAGVVLAKWLDWGGHAHPRW
jgi:hypothetical protein